MSYKLFSVGEYLRLQPNSWKTVKCMQAPIVYVGDYIIFIAEVPKCTFPNPPGGARGFAGRSFILAPNIQQEKHHYFCALVCCTGSVVYLAGWHLKKSQKLDLN